jgi:hypothetical protein
MRSVGDLLFRRRTATGGRAARPRAPLMVGSVTASAEQNQVLGDDLGAILFLTALLVLPRRGL